MQNKQNVLYVLVFFGLFVGWYFGIGLLFPKVAPPDKGDETNAVKFDAERYGKHLSAGATVGAFANLLPQPERVPDLPVKYAAMKVALGAPAALIQPPRPALPPKKPSERVTLGSADPQSTYHMHVILDTRGAGVLRVLLNKFQAVDERGQPVFEDVETKKIRKLLELVPEDKREALSNLLYHFDPNGADKDSGGDSRPFDTLGKVVWTKTQEEMARTPDGREMKRVVLQTRIDGVIVSKTYTLAEGEYHLGLEVKMWRADPDDKKNLWFRYQLAGAHGLPIEGQWYTNTFRNALIAQVDKANANSVYRDLQDARTLAQKEGGDEVVRDPNRILRYAAVGIQYFASAIVVDETQEKQDFLSRARPTLVTATVKGAVKSVAADGASFVLNVGDKYEQTLYLEDEESRQHLKRVPLGQHIGVLFRTEIGEPHRTDARGPRSVVLALQQDVKTQPLFDNDITVHVATEPIDLKDATDEGHAVVHKYLLYNGPMKPMLLGHMAAPANVSDELVDRYVTKLNLNTLVDYHTPGMMGSFASAIYWTNLLIMTTNIMHRVLGFLSNYLPYGLCIIVLTVLVRSMMFPLSRKAALTSIRMQELQPEVKKLKEKYKDDPQAFNMAVWQLQRKSGANPFSTCWLMLLQMPIFMGLYFALQENIHFRAASFWPTWLHNLAAPDMLWNWGESIPYISTPESYGNFIYLGPYFNILPVIAVTLMMFQQKLTMPPPTDEQQEMQQKMMKYMMVFMGLMFYKVPSGLTLYFIASSLWGFTERKLLPKKKKPATDTDPAADAPKETYLQTLLGGKTNAVTATNDNVNGDVKIEGKSRNRAKRGRAKRKSSRGGGDNGGYGAGEAGTGKEANVDGGSVFQRLHNWWSERKDRMNDWWEKLREAAQKKNRL